MTTAEAPTAGADDTGRDHRTLTDGRPDDDDRRSGSPGNRPPATESRWPRAALRSGARTDHVGTVSRGMVILLAAAGAVVLLLVGATAGLALSGKFGNSAPATPDNASVDAGFARDMIVHHDQGVLMAHYAEQNTTDPEIGVMAYDIGYTQTDQIGQMQGWLSLLGPAGVRRRHAHGLDGRDRHRPRRDGDDDAVIGRRLIRQRRRRRCR